ncbi:putative pentatricopeptide repeat-containing protein, partial [Cucurbita argyrosperma subsp. argyrosperma]
MPNSSPPSFSSTTSSNLYPKCGFASQTLLLFSSASDGCGNLASLLFYLLVDSLACVHGDQMHFLIWKHGFHAEVFVASALVDMYAKCCDMCTAEKNKVYGSCRSKFMIGPFSLTVLDELGVENLVHVNNSLIDMYAIIATCQQHGHANQVVESLKEMLREEITPDYITFISVLSACSHTGRVEEGFFYFNSMLNRAKRFIELMPIKPEAELLDLYYVAYEAIAFVVCKMKFPCSCTKLSSLMRK